MHANPSVDTYFIASRTDISRVTVEGDILWTPGPEGYPNGKPSGARLEKTIDALEWAQNSGYDFIVRTGLSSIWIYKNLLTFLETLPRTGVYCGIDGGNFVSGAGIIITPDIASLIITHRDFVLSLPNEEDVKLGDLFQRLGIPQRAATRVDIPSAESYPQILLPNYAYHFRVKFHISDPNVRKDEVRIMRDILQRYNDFFRVRE